MHDKRFMYRKGWRVRIKNHPTKEGLTGEICAISFNTLGERSYLVTGANRRVTRAFGSYREDQLECVSSKLQEIAERR